MSYIDEETGLLHYGVKGMKWGVRRKSGGSSTTKSKPLGPSARNAKTIKNNARKRKVESTTRSVNNKVSKAANDYINYKNKLAVDSVFETLIGGPKTSTMTLMALSQAEGMAIAAGRSVLNNAATKATMAMAMSELKRDLRKS